jgi:thiol-disulfide isomerase/thioredoxin
LIKKAVYFIVAVIAGALMEMSVSVIRGLLGFQWSALIGSVLIIILTYFISTQLEKRKAASWIRYGLPLGILLLVTPIVVSGVEESSIAIPDLACHSLASVVGCILPSLSKKYKIALLSCFGVVVLLTFWKYPAYVNYLTFTMNRDASVKYIDLSKVEPLLLAETNEAGRKHELFVYDFWNTRCGVCFKKLPQFAEIRNRWAKEYPVSFSLVNVPYAHETDTAIIERIRTFDTTFSLHIMRNPAYAQQLGIQGFPTVIAVKPDGEIVYFGSADELEEFLSDFFK